MILELIKALYWLQKELIAQGRLYYICGLYYENSDAWENHAGVKYFIRRYFLQFCDLYYTFNRVLRNVAYVFWQSESVAEINVQYKY